MRKLGFRAALLSSMALAVMSCTAAGEREQADKTNPDAALLRDFQTRIEQYWDVHKKAGKDAPAVKETSEPAKIDAAQEGLAQKIREARKDARAGEIFTPEIRQLFRRLMYPELKGAVAGDTKEAIKEDAPTPGTVTFKVNAAYPENQPLPTVPANILLSLPKLPEGLEYRIVGKTLILRDVDANLIVDFIPNAIR
jgi:hypothetical protein